MQMYNSVDESASNTVSYERSRMQKDMILQNVKKKRNAELLNRE